MKINVEKNTITASVGSLSPGDTFMHVGTFYILTDIGSLPELKEYDVAWAINLGTGSYKALPTDTHVEQVELAVVLEEDLKDDKC